MAKPTDVPEWALDDDFATGPAPVIGTPTKVDPGALSGQGFVPGTAAAAQIMNWLLNRNGRWAKWLDGLVSSDDGDDVMFARKTLRLLHSTVAKIEAANVDGGGGPLGRATLRSGAGGDHPQAIASSIEGEVYAGINSRADTEKSWLTLRGALREISGLNKAGSAAPIDIPNGLNVGTSFTPPAGYLPGVPYVRSTPGPASYLLPSGARGAMVDIVGAGGGASESVPLRGVGGGGGAYRRIFVPAWEGPADLVVGLRGITASDPGESGTDGGDSAFYAPTMLATAFAEGGGANGSGGAIGSEHPYDVLRLAGRDGTRAYISSGSDDTISATGGASGIGWSSGSGGSIFVGGAGGSRSNGSDGIIVVTPYF